MAPKLGDLRKISVHFNILDRLIAILKQYVSDKSVFKMALGICGNLRTIFPIQLSELKIEVISPSSLFVFISSLLFLVIATGCDLIDPVLPAVAPSAPTVTPFPTATADPSGRFIAYLSTDFGVSLRHPPNWIVSDEENLQIASSADLLTSAEVGGSGALMSIEPASEELIEFDNLADPLRNFVIDSGDFKIVEEPNNILMGGQPAAVLTALSNSSSGREMTHVFALIKNGRAGIVVTGTTGNPDANEALLRGILGTIIVSRPEPTPAPPTLTPRPPATRDPNATVESGSFGENQNESSGSDNVQVPAGLLQFQSSDGRFSLGYPSDWLVRDDGDAIIFASSEALLIDNKFETGASVLIFSQSVSTPAEPDPLRVLEDFISQFAIYDDLELVIPPRSMTLGGQNAAHAQYDNIFQRYPILVDYYVVVKEQNIVIMVNLITLKEFEALKPITDGMATSITINP